MADSENMSGKTCVVTGANAGIGKETARALAHRGAHVVLVCRNGPKGEAAMEEIRRESGSTRLDLLIADMSSMESVRALASEMQKRYPRLDVLLNNAGAALQKRTLSTDGIEMTIAGNHLGPALLTLLLRDLLKASAPSRVINVSSEAQRHARLDLNDLQFERRKYSGFAAYGQSKLLMNAFTFELARRLETSGVTANCLHPGVVRTNIGGTSPGLLFKIIVAAIRPFMLDPKQGAEGSVYLASSPAVSQVSGKYFVKCKPAEPNPLLRDPKVWTAIWEWTEKMTGHHWE
ncbi:MAG TPA: SDR family oxidoreductase [Candidatus Acidoferrum sp.]|nr:SDR family oxidoreductase [Candidatus Acidoferrum sp.]